MNKGLESILKKIRDNPHDQILASRFLSLVAEHSENHTKSRLLLGFAAAIHKAEPLDAIHVAYLVYCHDRTAVNAIEIMIDALKVMGRHGKAEVMSNELARLKGESARGGKVAQQKVSGIDLAVEDLQLSKHEIPLPKEALWWAVSSLADDATMTRALPEAKMSPPAIAFNLEPSPPAKEQSPVTNPVFQLAPFDIEKKFPGAEAPIRNLDFAVQGRDSVKVSERAPQHDKITLVAVPPVAPAVSEPIAVSKIVVASSVPNAEGGFWDVLRTQLRPLNLLATLSAGQEAEAIRRHLLNLGRAEKIEIPSEGLSSLVAALVGPNNASELKWQANFAEAVWEGLGPVLAQQLLDSIGHRSFGSEFWGYYLDGLLRAGRARRALFEVRRSTHIGSDPEWVVVAMAHLPAIWEQLNLKGFRWREEEGVTSFVERLSYREGLTMAHLMASS